MPQKRYTQSLWMRCHRLSLSAVQPYLEGRQSRVVSYLGDRAVKLRAACCTVTPREKRCFAALSM